MKFSQLKVGLLVLIGFSIFIFFILVVGSRDNLFGSNYDIRMFVQDSEGLVAGSKVSAGGLKVGYVKELAFAEQDGLKGIEITLRMEDRYKNLITQSSVATIKSIGMLGDRYVHVSIGNAQDRPLQENELITTETAFSLESAGSDIQTILTNFNKSLVNLTAITDSIRAGKGVAGRLLGENQMSRNFEETLNTLQRIIQRIEGGQGTLGKLLADDTLYNNLNYSAANLQTISGSVVSGKGTLGKLFKDDSLYRNLTTSSARLDSLLAKANSDSSAIGQLLTNGALYDEIEATTTNLNLLIKDIRENPDRYVKLSLF